MVHPHCSVYQHYTPFYEQYKYKQYSPYSTIWIHHVLVIYSSVDGHLEFSHVLANVNSVVMNIHIQMIISIPAFNSFH